MSLEVVMRARASCAKCKIVLFLMYIGLSHPLFAGTSSNVETAITFLKAACVTSGVSLDIKASGDGSLQLRSLAESGIKGAVKLSKTEVEGFADAASTLSAQQASEMRVCMKPYIDKILCELLPKCKADNLGGSLSGATQTPLKTDMVISYGFNFKLMSCSLDGQNLRCVLKVTNTMNAQRCLSIRASQCSGICRNSASPGSIRDDGDNEYLLSQVTRGNRVSNTEFDMAFSPNDTSEIKLDFVVSGASINMLKELQIGANLCDWTGFRPVFRNIPVL